MGFIYVIEDNLGRVKIGKSINPEQRFKTISSTAGINIIKKHVTGYSANYSRIESIALGHFTNEKRIGEWISADFDEVVSYVDYVYKSIGIFHKPKEKEDNFHEIMKPFIDENKRFANYAFDKIILHERVKLLKNIGDYISECTVSELSWEKAFAILYNDISEECLLLGQEEFDKAICDVYGSDYKSAIDYKNSLKR